MVNTTNDYITAIKDYGRQFQNRLTISSGFVTEVYTNVEIEITESFALPDEISMGKGFSKSATIKVYEPIKTISYKDATYTIESGLKVGNAFEYVNMGTFYAEEVSSNDDYKTLDIVAYDKLIKLNETYEPQIVGSITDTGILSDICTQYGLTLETGTSGLGISLESVYEASALDTLGYIAGLQGKNAILNRDNELEFRFYTDTDYEVTPSNQKESGLEIKSGNQTITSLISGTESNKITSGSGLAITFYNPYMTQAILDGLLTDITGLTYCISSLSMFGNPAIEIGDVLIASDRDETEYSILVSSQTITLKGGCSSVIESNGTSNNEIVYNFETPTERKIKANNSVVKEEMRTATEKMLGVQGGYYELLIDNVTGKPYGFQITDTATITSTTKGWRGDNTGIWYTTDGFQTVSKVALDMTDGKIVADSVVANNVSSPVIELIGTDPSVLNDAYLRVQTTYRNGTGRTGNSAQRLNGAYLLMADTTTVDDTQAIYSKSKMNYGSYGIYGYNIDDVETIRLQTRYGRLELGDNTGTSPIDYAGLYINGKKMKDYVTETGTSNGWLYRKWYSGKAEAWIRQDPGTVAVNSWWGNVCQSGQINRPTVPTGFTVEYTFANGATKGTSYSQIGVQITNNGASCTFIRPDSYSTSAYIYWHIIGTMS